MSAAIRNLINQMIQPLAKRIKLSIGKCVLDSITDSTGLQTAKIVLLADEVLDEVERLQEYGFTSVPLQGCEGVAVFVGGNRGNAAIIATDDRRTRPTDLAEGDSAIYTAGGSIIKLTNADQGLTIECEGPVVINSATSIQLGDTATEKMLKGETFQAFFNAHTHTGNLGAPTGPPNTLSSPTDLSLKVRAE